MKLKYLFILSIFIISCSDKEKTIVKMELMVLSNYGAEEKIVSDSTSIAQIKETMKGIDWNNFTQVILSTDNSNWIEVGGNLDEDGLSSMYELNGKLFVINKPPSSSDHMTEILLSYLNGDGKFKKENNYE